MRVLFLAEGATMAHFTRPLSLASSLDPAEHTVYFYAPPSYSTLLQDQPFQVGVLETMPSNQFLSNLAKGAPLYSRDTLRRYVQHDRELIRQVKPDLIVGDLRLSLPISARLESTRFAMLMNAYWNPSPSRPRIVPEIPLTRALPPRLINPLFRLLEPAVARSHVGQVNQVRSEFGIPPLPSDFGHMYMDADFVLHPDVPDFVRLPAVPNNHRFLGVCEWAPPAGLPSWWSDFLADSRPKILVALGSSGPVRILPRLLAVLSDLDLAVALATSGRDVPLPASVYATDLVPLDKILKHVDLVISHGGSPLVYPALAAGRPTLAIPSNADQQLSADLLLRRGAGLRVRSEEASASRLKQSVQRLLRESRFRDNAYHWQAVFARYDSKILFPAFVNSLR